MLTTAFQRLHTSSNGIALFEALLGLLLFSILGTAALSLSQKSFKQITKNRSLFLKEDRLTAWKEDQLSVATCSIMPEKALPERKVKCNRAGQKTGLTSAYFIID